jgi:hypothetical protein
VEDDDQPGRDDGEQVGDGQPPDAPSEDEVARPQGVDDGVGRGDEEEVEENEDGELLFAGLDPGDPAEDGVGPFGGDAAPPTGRIGVSVARKGRRVNDTGGAGPGVML